jgi:hypothetical protein
VPQPTRLVIRMERVPGALLRLGAGVVAEQTEQRWGERRSSRPGRGCVGAVGGERIPWRGSGTRHVAASHPSAPATAALVQIDCMGKRIPDAASRLQAPSTAFQTADAVRP